MIVNLASRSAYDSNITIVHVKTEAGEIIRKGDLVTIELRDGNCVKTKVTSLKFWCRPGEKEPEYLNENSTGEIVILGVPPNTIRTANDPSENYFAKYIGLTPYREINGGDKSIYDFVQHGYAVPDKVILYLKTARPYMMCPGVYNHPFKDDTRLMGTYWNTDEKHYYWDKNTWKYVVKYGLTLPQKFIDYVMSEEGTLFLEENAPNNLWKEKIRRMKNSPNMICLFPDDAGDKDLKEF